MLKNIIIFSIGMLVITPLLSFSQLKIKRPINVLQNMVKAGSNRGELEKAAIYFEKKGEPQQLAALYFLIGNMDIHYSIDYSMQSKKGEKIKFDEFRYSTFDSAAIAFTKLKNRTDIITREENYQDIKTITADFLINNIELAFKKWKQSLYKDIPFADFCEYILPYRVVNEPIQKWRDLYNSQFYWISDTLSAHNLDTTIRYLHADVTLWWRNTTGLNRQEERIDPLPFLGPKQLIFRKMGPCSDVAIMDVYALRSQGIPSSYDYIPFWGTSTGSHIINSVFDKRMKGLSFDLYKFNGIFGRPVREPAKVFRITYSKQKGTLASLLPQSEIPEGILQTLNYTDATSQHWKTAEIQSNLFDTWQSNKVAYTCCYSGGKWQPVWWGWVKKGKATFSNMSVGCPYLPAFYKNGDLVPAGYPIIVRDDGSKMILEPDEVNVRKIIIKEEDKYLVFRPDNNYQLFYWKDGWLLVDEKVASGRELYFDKVPANSLLLLVPEYSQGKERPFTIDEKGQRSWW
jgi:hypothetical protein